jgi:hypothetical protein
MAGGLTNESGGESVAIALQLFQRLWKYERRDQSVAFHKIAKVMAESPHP